MASNRTGSAAVLLLLGAAAFAAGFGAGPIGGQDPQQPAVDHRNPSAQRKEMIHLLASIDHRLAEQAKAGVDGQRETAQLLQGIQARLDQLDLRLRRIEAALAKGE
ncbi:MAG: hypothetical protein D6702_08040 [Planctomycetota bacterium]|nr:MAG: hypothetical protein D6702_08040 [Planctomycetota bacterium]